MFNARSVRNKDDIIHTFIIDSKSSIVAITETWLTNNDSSIPSQFTPTNFDIIQANRLSLFNNFLSELESLFESISTDNLIILSDFNVQVNTHSLFF